MMMSTGGVYVDSNSRALQQSRKLKAHNLLDVDLGQWPLTGVILSKANL